MNISARVLLASAVGIASLVALVAADVVLAAPSGWLAVDGNIRFNTLSGANVDWANSGVGPPTYVCPVGAVNLPGPGGLFNCGRLAAGSAPPIAPTLTPAAASDPSIITADFISDAITSDTTACGPGDPTLISGGSKNGDAITSYTANSGSILAKDDLSNVYAVSHTRADTGHPELYFAAERLDNNGDSHMDFEFMQAQIGLSTPCGGTFIGHRTEGDLLVAVDFTGGGTTAGASVYQWHCLADPSPQPADGTVCDPVGTTPPQHYEQILAPTFLTFTVNAIDVPCGGWVCRDKTGTTATVTAHDFLEGGIDLAGIPFGGCFNSFLPHTRTAQSFTSALKDFAGPVGLRSCRDPAITTTSAPGQVTAAPGAAATDSIVVGNGGAGPIPTGSVTFFLCGPGQTTAGGCPAGGTQVGSPKTLSAGTATSDPTGANSAPGTYCWRTVYAPDSGSTGIFAAATHTNVTSECFGIAATPGLPNTGVPAAAGVPALPWGGFILLLALPLAVIMRRTRAGAVLGIALVAAAVVPDASVPTSRSAPMIGIAQGSTIHRVAAIGTPESSIDLVTAGTIKAHPGWRLVIPSIGVDALIERVGLDEQGAVGAPSRLDGVGWYGRGALPGQPGNAVLDGHLGLPWAPAVFGRLGQLRPGDTFDIVWPDGHQLHFRVTSSVRVSADAPAPPGLFARSGPSRVSLITCAGVWIQGKTTYSERLIVTATAA